MRYITNAGAMQDKTLHYACIGILEFISKCMPTTEFAEQDVMQRVTPTESKFAVQEALWLLKRGGYISGE